MFNSYMLGLPTLGWKFPGHLRVKSEEGRVWGRERSQQDIKPESPPPKQLFYPAEIVFVV